MFKYGVETVIALTLAFITFVFFRQRSRVLPRHRGFDLLLCGLALVSAGATMDAFEIQDRTGLSESTRSALLFVELVLGYFFGILLAGVGLSLWVPALVRYQEQIRRRHHAEEALLRTEVEVEARSQALQLANQLTERLHRRLDVATIAREAVDVLVHDSQPPMVAFYILDQDATRLRLVADHGFDESTRKIGAELPVAGSLSGKALAEGQALVFDDVATDDRLEPKVKDALLVSGVTSGIVIPLEHRETAIGTINLVYHDRREFSAVDLANLQSVGRTVALAIANARLVTSLEHRAFHDSLTGLPNRAGLRRELDRRLSEHEDACTGLILFDLDRFKEINEALGHYVGDQLLTDVGRRLKAAVGREDALVCRLGGDEFAAMLPSVDGPEEVDALARRLVSELRRPYSTDGLNLSVGASAGVAISPDHGRDSLELLRCADVAMYEAKRTAASVTRYAPELDRHTPQRLALMAELASAIQTDQLVLHYQPQIALDSARVVGFEALVRWQHPQRGLLQPNVFVPLAEVSDLIQDLTAWVMKAAVGQLHRWRARGLDTTVAVNLSPRNLQGRDCATRLTEIADRAGVSPADIVIELTETALMIDPEAAVATLERIAELGTQIAIDDFGTGYSSLAYLTRYPVHSLKIDRSFVHGMLGDEQARAIVRSTVGMARDLDLLAVAEGIEDEATAAALIDMGCHQAQGFAIGRPEPSDGIDARLDGDGWAFLSKLDSRPT